MEKWYITVAGVNHYYFEWKGRAFLNAEVYGKMRKKDFAKEIKVNGK